MTSLTHYREIPAYVAKDGSEIRELMRPDVQGNQAQSLAEATVPPATRTVLHRHGRTDGLYHVTASTGPMTFGERRFEVSPGDTVCIVPGTPHCIENTGDEPFRILCACSPDCAHRDTELLEGE